MSMMKAEAGDVRHMWDHSNADEVAAAREMFDSMLRRGFRAYKAEGKHGDRGDLLPKFDAEAERIIFFKPNVGG